MSSIPQITVIIPMFNAAQSIEKCLQSLIKQTYTAFIIHLIDDGSTDETYTICQRFAKKDERINLFHKENSGVSLTRQFGLAQVTTPFFIFCDADDYVDSDYLRLLYNAINQGNSDIAICSYIEEFENNSQIIATPHFQHTFDLIDSFLQDKVWGVTWNKLYKTKIVRDYHIKFVPHLQMWEDLTFTIDYCLHTKKVTCIDKPLYHYVKTNTQSITSKENIRKKIDRVKSIKHFENTMKSIGVEETFHNSLVKVKFHICRTFLNKDFTEERMNHFLTSFPEIFNDKYFIRNYPISYIMIKLGLVKYLNIECFIKEYKNRLRSCIKNILEQFYE